MDLLSGMLISKVIVTIGVIMLCFSFYSNKKVGVYCHTCALVGLWLIMEVACDYATTSFSYEVNEIESVTYYFLLASTSLLFLYEVCFKGDHLKGTRFTFLVITISCVLMALYRWFVQSNWDSVGFEFYSTYGTLLDSIFVYTIAAMDALMIVLGVHSALVTFNNSNNSICSERR